MKNSSTHSVATRTKKVGPQSRVDGGLLVRAQLQGQGELATEIKRAGHQWRGKGGLAVGT